jgi:hypothetical protein
MMLLNFIFMIWSTAILVSGNLRFPPSDLKVHVVYMLFLNHQNDRWEHLVGGQLGELRNCGLAERATSFRIHISLGGFITSVMTEGVETFTETGRPSNDEFAHLLERATGLVKRFVPSAIISYKLKNQYEYQGIKLAHEVALNVTAEEAHENLVLYFHAKCMWNRAEGAGAGDARCFQDKLMFKYVIVPWRNVTSLFGGHVELNKAGLGISPGGVVWGMLHDCL